MGRRRKLEAEEVVKVKEMLWQGTAQQDIADHFGISQATVSRIQRGDQWTHIRWPDNSHGPLPIEREQQIIAQRFPGVAVRGIITNALRDGLSVEEVARRVQGEVEVMDEGHEEHIISELLLEDTGEREEMPDKQELPITLITNRQWVAFKKLYPTVWWKDVEDKDRVKRTAVYTALTAEGAEDIPGSALRSQINQLEEKIRRQQEKK
jgi:hypothetical protein